MAAGPRGCVTTTPGLFCNYVASRKLLRTPANHGQHALTLLCEEPMTDHNAEAKAEHIIASVYEAAGMSAGARPSWACLTACPPLTATAS